MTEPRDRAILETAIRHLRKHDLLCFDYHDDSLGDDPQGRLVDMLLAALLTPTTPRSWSLPPEPPAGTRLRGIVTVLRDGADHPCEYQRDTVFPDLWVEVGASHRRFTWGELLTREGPLTEVVDSDG